jgi:putative membrane protein
MNWQDQGKEPDYRFTLANERTFLAWIRTALALLAGAVVLHQFVKQIEPTWLIRSICVLLTVAGASMAVVGFKQWRANQIAMRMDRALPPSSHLLIVSGFVVLLAFSTAGLFALS